MNQTAKRILSLVLCLAMLVGIFPAFALGAKAAETVIDAAIFCSDVHGSSSDLTSVLSGVKTSGVDYSSIGFVGDTALTVATTTSTVQSALGDTNISVMFSYAASHDTENSADISTNWDYSGEVEGVSDYYLVYTIRETDMQNSSGASTAAPAFTTWYNGLTAAQKALPIFIMSHRPLHDRRDDNAGAATWYSAISAAAETSDIVFFWAHNHTGETEVDTAAYYVAKDGDETFTVYNGETVTPNFTYMNAGYINANNQNPARIGVATTVQITADSLIFQDYNSSGEYTGTYAHNTTVAREFASSTDSGDGSTDTTTPTEGETTTEEKEVYVLVDSLTADGEYLIVNTNTAGSGYAMNHSSGTEGAVAVTVQESGDYIYIDLDDSTAVWKATTKSSGFELMNGSYYLEAYGSTSAIEISTTQAYSARYWTYDSTAYDLSYDGGTGDHSIQYTSGAFSSTKDGAVIYIYEKQTITVSSDGTVSGGGSGDSGDSGEDDTTGGSTDTTYAEGTYTTADDGSYQKVTFGTSTTETKTVYVLTDTMTSGENYLIVDSNSTSGNALINSSNSVGNTTVTINSGSLTIDGTTSTKTYIVLDNSNAVWTAGTSGSNGAFKNGSYYLYHKNGKLSLVTSTNNTNWTWDGTDNYLYYSGGGTKYLVYNNGWAISETADNIYLYQEVEATVSTGTSVTYSVDAENVKHIYDSDEATAETATISKTLTEDAPDGNYTYTIVSDENGIISGDIASDGTITFSGTEGTATVKVAYTFTQNDVEYTIWDTITVTASYPYYTVDLTHNSDGTGAVGTTADYVSTPDTIAIKGVEEGDTYDLWAKVYLNGDTEATVVDSSALTWSTNNSSVISATDDGNIVFTGNEGTAQVTVYYAYTDKDGNTVRATDVVTFSVTKSSYFIPSDGTEDFPEYPNQGSIRIDKTGVALGNFSQTGIAQMELSMTGVPYGTNAKTDVVIMVDMTASMSDDDVTAAESAVKELITSLVYDSENKKYDSNIQLFVDVFYSASSDSSFATEEYLNCVTISSDSELSAATGKIDFTQSSNGGGTRYNLAMKDVYETLTRDGHADNQYAIFVSDGVATAYAPLTDGELGTTITGSNSETASLCAGWFDDEGEVTSEFETEYYSYLIKTAGIPMYTVGANLTELSDAADLLNHMSSNYSPDGKTATGQTKYSFFCTTSGGITDEVLKIFRSIGQDIREAATNVVVEDKIADEYTMNFSLPSGVTATEAGMENFYIQAVSYELDENNERSGDPTVIEKFLFNSDGTITHTIGTTTCGDSCTHVTYDSNGKVSAIDGTYFDYTRTVNTDGTDSETITWNAEKLDRSELALQYFLYLDNSAGNVAAADQVAPGTYDTNAYAHITYTNHLGNECRQYFPVPSLTWKGAKVTYVFYLVNEAGQPVNRAGKVIPFAEAVYVTDPVSFDVTWNEIEGQENLLAENLMASAKVPEVYSLYDTSASYVIRVYETEGVDTTAKNGNYFEIAGADDKLIDSALDSDTTANNSTTKVFNTKSGVKYDQYGIYSTHAVGTELATGKDADGNATYTTTAIQAADIDYANTTVAFAVVWKPELTPDTVVIDYGLDVVIDVYENDGLAAGVSGVSLTEPTGVEMNKGTYGDSQKVGSDSVTGGDGVWTAAKESLTSVRFSLDKDKGMQFSEPAVFYYEAGVNYYTYDSAGTATLNTTNMYSSVTVIPATTIYYEDEYVTLKTFTSTGETDESGNTIYTETNGWATNSVAASATQDQDRPGASKISEDLDADNLYGYDSAYQSQSRYSMGNAAKVTVKSGVYATAEFDFYGTGFDIISLTDTTTGVIVVKVYDESGDEVIASTVNNYYGYARVYYQVTYTYDADTAEWSATSEKKVNALGESDAVPTDPDDGDTYTVYETRWETTTSNDPNALYQVPVLKVGNGDTTDVLPYGKYTAVITVSYMSFLDKTSAEGYDFYLDAIRIYNPTGNKNETANNAYVADGEGWPAYHELRNLIISAETFSSLSDDTSISGIVFIDGATNTGAADAASVADYISYGPNNELYLEANNAVAFDLNATASAGAVAKIQLAIKTVGGSGSIWVYSVDSEGATETCLDQEINTATDMYFDITDLNGKTVVIKNNGAETDAIISITNVKITYTAAQTTPEPSNDGSDETSNVSVASVEDTAEQAAAAESIATFSVSRSTASYALMSMSTEETDEPETEATEPETEPTEPETEATEPETEPTEPETEATEPETEATEPETEATEPEDDESTGSNLIGLIKKLLGWLFG